MTEAQTHAWIFLSVPNTPASLQDVIGMADAINHAIPTDKELKVSFGWLQAQGLIQKTERKYSLTEAGMELRKTTAQKTIMKSWDSVTLRFSKMNDPKASPDDVSTGEIGAAYSGYKKWFWSTYKKLNEKDHGA